MADGLSHREGCVCYGCRRRRRRLKREAMVTPRVLVRSDRAAAHIAELVAGGMKRGEIAAAAGVSAALISKAGRPGGSLNQETEEKILAVPRPRRLELGG